MIGKSTGGIERSYSYDHCKSRKKSGEFDEDLFHLIVPLSLYLIIFALNNDTVAEAVPKENEKYRLSPISVDLFVGWIMMMDTNIATNITQ